MAAVLCLPDGYSLALATKTPGSVAVTALAVIWTLTGIRRSLGGHRNDKIIA
ncbi:hypothetical protein [Actinoplanes utahensis]|uniref:hypothetical protein n=1 Tax=Actinoplanes utahensis TaxID=1869 RepID=UPI000AA2E3A0|nr:hypothetical protein [Actinoplanes utahensis]GIF31264.1 hypothetical protein Aut01nite_42500 [Actinoplanes utahensis]